MVVEIVDISVRLATGYGQPWSEAKGGTVEANV